MPERAGHGIVPRDPTDYYATPPDLARLICLAVRRDFRTPDRAAILEPGCGAGSFLDAIRRTWPQADVQGVEVHEDLAEYARGRGFSVELADILHTPLGRYDAIIGNPPFRYADDFIPLLLRHLKPGGVLALFLRLNYLSGRERYGGLWSERPPALIYALPARPGFTPDGKTDATDYCVVVWQEGYTGPTGFAWLDNRGIRNRWDGSEPYPDPRKSPMPAHAEINGRVTLSEWENDTRKERVRP